jgi:Rhs element Vgr protein
MGLTNLPPGSEPPTDVVTRKVFINDTELSNEILLSQLSVVKSFNKIASAKLVFQDGSAADRDFVLSNDDKFKPGNEIKIQLGYHGQADTVFEGIIIKHAVKVMRGSSVLIIDAKDKAVKLTGARKSVYHNNKIDSDVMTTLAGSLKKDIDPTRPSHVQLVQFDSTDWDFIVTRAEANGMLVLTDDGKLIIKKPVLTPPPVLVAAYGANIWEFEAEMDARRQVQSVTAHSWDYTKQAPEKSTKGVAQGFTEPGNLSSTDLAAVMATEINLTHPGHLKPDHLQNWADAFALRNKLSKAVGRVRVTGNATVKPGTVITLKGVGNRFNGDVFVTGVLHQFSGLWQTDIQFGWKEELFYHKEKVMDKPAAGLLPGINGLHIGKVITAKDDEEGQYRIKVHVPTITSGDEGIWARVATLDAGPERGSYFRPVKDDEVVLGFLNDDPREAIILGCMHNKDKNKSPLPENADGLEFGFVTREKIKMIFDDTNKRMTLSVKTASGVKSIILNDSNSAMELKDENGNTIKMEASGITIDAGKGNVTIKGAKVMIN